MIEWVIGIIVGLMLGAVIIGFIEYLIDEPVFILKLLVRDFKIALFTELNDDTTSNKQLYVIVGVTWFNKIISYQAISNPFNDSYSKCFTAKKRGWIINKCRGTDEYLKAKETLEQVRLYYFEERYRKNWIGGLLKEEEI